MPRPPSVESPVIDGPAGRLEALLETPLEREVSGSVVVCHPHPQYGGTMHNKVAHTLARAFLRSGYSALRFNFRGIGQSEGNYDAGRGELDDALAALEWAREQQSGSTCWIAGFSFGAAIAVKAATVSAVDGLISVAPAVTRFAAELERQPACPWLVVQGDQDELVDVDETLTWVNSLDPGPELLIMPGAEHFFHGRLVELREAVMDFVAENQQ